MSSLRRAGPLARHPLATKTTAVYLGFPPINARDDRNQARETTMGGQPLASQAPVASFFPPQVRNSACLPEESHEKHKQGDAQATDARDWAQCGLRRSGQARRTGWRSLACHSV